jgi:4-hydroxybenzoate polyprenyltransferase
LPKLIISGNVAPNRQVGYKPTMAGSIQKILSFTKVEHTVFSLPLLFSGAWIGAGNRWPKFSILLLLLAAGVGARILGMAANRILDRHIDAKNPRTKNRELPSGALSMKTAVAVALFGLALYEIACIMLGPLVAFLSPIPAIVLIGYSLLKRFTPLCHFGIGLAMGLAPLGAFTAVSLSLHPCSDIVLTFFFAFFWMSGFDIIYALLDIDFDRGASVHSIPAAVGARRASLIAAACHLAAFGMLSALFLSGDFNAPALLCLIAAAGAFVAAHLPMIPVSVRFFPISAAAGIAGALVPFFK